MSVKLKPMLGYTQIGRKIYIAFWPDKIIAIEHLKIAPSEMGLDLTGTGGTWLNQFDVYRRDKDGKELGFQEEFLQRECDGKPAILPEQIHSITEVLEDNRCWHTEEEIDHE